MKIAQELKILTAIPMTIYIKMEIHAVINYLQGFTFSIKTIK